MPVRFLDSDNDGEPRALIEPVPLGHARVWLALDQKECRGLMLLLQAAKSAASIRDQKRVMPLSFHAALDGLRMGLERCGPLLNALDPPKEPAELTREELGDEPFESFMEELRRRFSHLPRHERRKMADRMRDVGFFEESDIPPEW